MAHIHIWTGGSNTSPYDTWAKAATTLPTGASAVSADDTVHIAAESFSVGQVSPQIVNQTWKGGYSSLGTDYSDSVREGWTSITSSALYGGIRFNQGPFSGKTFILERCECESPNGPFFGGNSGTVNSFNCSFSNVGSTIITNANVGLTNCVVYGFDSVVSHNDSLKTITAKNTIFANCNHLVSVGPDSWTKDVTYSDIYNCSDFDVITTTTNIYADPLFVDAPGGDFDIGSDSPCVDAGDPAENDPNGSRIDIGMYGGTERAQTDPPITMIVPSGAAYLMGEIPVRATASVPSGYYMSGAGFIVDSGSFQPMTYITTDGYYQGYLRTADYPNGWHELTVYTMDEASGVYSVTTDVNFQNVDYSESAKGQYIGDHYGKGTQGKIWGDDIDTAIFASRNGYNLIGNKSLSHKR